MAMKPRTRRSRPNPPKDWSGPRPPSTTDPRRRRRPGPRPEAPPTTEPGPAPEPQATASTLDAVLDDFTESWERGERPQAERYLGLLPAGDSAELIYHEFCLAEAADLLPDPEDYLRRFPDHAEPLSRLFTLHGAFSASTLRDWADPADLPSDGDEIGPYRLLRELGRGAFARVFLAEETGLGRLVVLKVSARSTAESRLLARAEHSHIVKVIREADANDGALHLVCMPFLGGATLASVLEARRKLGRRPASGLDLLADLDRVSAPEYPSADLRRADRAMIAGLSYPKALAWIVARLAEALDYAHGQGVAHGDLKPSNVLLTAEGTPMLFDFNLAVDWHGSSPGDSTTDLGGTLAYMAPERLAAIADGGRGRPPKASDLHRADLYAMGLLLLESLTGRAPEVDRGRASGPRELAGTLAGRRRTLPDSLRGPGNSAVPPALRSILGRCLAPDPADRYARGGELAEDLDRWRSDRPLAFAEEPRRATLTRKVRQRRLPLIGVGLTFASALAVSVVAWMMLLGSKRDVASALSSETRRSDSGAFAFRDAGYWQPLEQGDLADLAARQLARYDVIKHADWRDRDDIRMLPDRERGEQEAWLFEQILRFAVALGERPASPEDWRRGLDLLERTLARVSSAPLQAERRALRAKLNLPDPAPSPADMPRLPRWMESYLAGVLAEPLRAREALGHYLDALRERPDMFWGHYRAAVVACRIDEYPLSVEHLRECVGREPDNAKLHLQFASSLYHAERVTPQVYKLKPSEDALAECDRAVELDPDFVRARQIRAFLRQSMGRDDGVESDLKRVDVLTRAGGPSLGLKARLGLNFHGGSNYGSPTDLVEKTVRQILENDPRDHESRAIHAAVAARRDRPAEAIADFGRVLDSDPDHLRARYQRANEIYRDDQAAAIPEFTSLIEHPRFEELFKEQPTALRAFHRVATDLLDRGQIAEALDVVNRGLVHAKRSRSLQNETILAREKAGNQVAFSPRGESYYLLARIYAVAARKDRGEFGRVVESLDLAFACNDEFRKSWFAKDRLFDGLRDEICLELQSRPLDR